MGARDAFDDRISARLNYVQRAFKDLHLYQLEAYEFLRDNPFSALFIDMGLGKTITSLTVVVEALSNFVYDKILIVGPLRVATETWPTEIGLWEHTAPFNAEVIHAFDDDPRLAAAREIAKIKARADADYWELPSAQAAKFIQHAMQRAETCERDRIRVEAAKSNKSIHIISRDWLEWLVYLHGPKWPYRCVIIDESSGFKDHKTDRFKALAKVRNTPGLITRLHCLTATPAAETYEHLWAQLYLMDMGARLGKDITYYRRRYFIENRYTRKWDLRPDAEQEILAKIADICLVMKAEDYLDLEKPVIVPRRVKLDAASMALYEEMAEELVVTMPDGKEVEAETAAALSQKLRQIASGVLYDTFFEDDDDDDFKKVKKVYEVHDHKLDALRQIVEEAQGSPLMVAYHHKSSLLRLKKAFPHAVVMDRAGKCVKPWNAGKIPMLLIHPQSGGHGLNMQTGPGHHIVFFDLTWSLELYLQLIGRLARQGQKAVVIVQVLLAAGTIDERVFECLNAKEDAQDNMFAILKRLIKSLKRQRSNTPKLVAD